MQWLRPQGQPDGRLAACGYRGARPAPVADSRPVASPGAAPAAALTRSPRVAYAGGTRLRGPPTSPAVYGYPLVADLWPRHSARHVACRMDSVHAPAGGSAGSHARLRDGDGSACSSSGLLRFGLCSCSCFCLCLS